MHTAYGFLKGLPFSAYGEASILFAQNVLLLALVYHYQRLPLSRRLAAAIMAAGAIGAVLSGACMQLAAWWCGAPAAAAAARARTPRLPRARRAFALPPLPRRAGRVSLQVIRTAYDANNLILISARIPQILTNLRNKSTGQLSIITYAANTAGCVARLFTTMQEGGGAAMLRSYCISECARGRAQAKPQQACCARARAQPWRGRAQGCNTLLGLTAGPHAHVHLPACTCCAQACCSTACSWRKYWCTATKAWRVPSGCAAKRQRPRRRHDEPSREG